jgi:hypothetical protein
MAPCGIKLCHHVQFRLHTKHVTLKQIASNDPSNGGIPESSTEEAQSTVPPQFTGKHCSSCSSAHMHAVAAINELRLKTPAPEESVCQGKAAAAEGRDAVAAAAAAFSYSGLRTSCSAP